MPPSRIHNNMRDLRQQRGGMTQAELARAVGVTRQTIIAIENNKYSPSLEVAFRIAGIFGVPIAQVFSYQPD